MKKVLALSLALAATLPITACNKAPETTETNDAFANDSFGNEAGLPAEGLGLPADNAAIAADNAIALPADNAVLTPVDNATVPAGNAL